MKQLLTIIVTASLVGLPVFVGGCDREIASKESVQVKDDGTVKKDKVQVTEKADGTVVTYDGTNGADMVGFYVPENISNRDAFNDRVYLAPVGEAQISEYSDKGYTLSQTPGW